MKERKLTDEEDAKLQHMVLGWGREQEDCIGCDKIQHLLRSIHNQPNHLKSKRVKKILEEQIDKQINLAGSLK